MNKPVRTTLVFGIISALFSIPLIHFTNSWGGMPFLKLFLAFNLAGYTILTCRWSNTPLVSVLFPILLAFFAAFGPVGGSSFLILILILFSWIRSGICFKDKPLRAVMAESLTMIGGAGFILLWLPGPSLALPVAVWLFYLIQTLYFFIVPVEKDLYPALKEDVFDHAYREAERVLKD